MLASLDMTKVRGPVPSRRPKSERTERVTIRMTPAEKKALQRTAREQGINIADMIRQLLRPMMGMRALSSSDISSSDPPDREE
jgi:hypothetical protein